VKRNWAGPNGAYAKGLWSDAIYHSYNTMISSAKALLLDKGVNSSTQAGVIKEFDAQLCSTGELALEGTFSDLVLQINKNEPSEEFATAYKQQATDFLKRLK
jgi:sulfite reductase (ferredoxin)